MAQEFGTLSPIVLTLGNLKLFKLIINTRSNEVIANITYTLN